MQEKNGAEKEGESTLKNSGQEGDTQVAQFVQSQVQQANFGIDQQDFGQHQGTLYWCGVGRVEGSEKDTILTPSRKAINHPLAWSEMELPNSPKETRGQEGEKSPEHRYARSASVLTTTEGICVT